MTELKPGDKVYYLRRGWCVVYRVHQNCIEIDLGDGTRRSFTYSGYESPNDIIPMLYGSSMGLISIKRLKRLGVIPQ